MGRVNTTVSSTPCYKKRPESGARAWVRWCAALACLLALCWYAPAAQAQQHGEVSDLQLERGADGLYLSAALRLELPTIVQDALYKGISMHFIADAEVLHGGRHAHDLGLQFSEGIDGFGIRFGRNEDQGTVVRPFGGVPIDGVVTKVGFPTDKPFGKRR